MCNACIEFTNFVEKSFEVFLALANGELRPQTAVHLPSSYRSMLKGTGHTFNAFSPSTQATEADVFIDCKLTAVTSARIRRSDTCACE